MTKLRRERVNQKLRTRSAILSVAVAMLEDGLTPSVAEVADAAGVGRTTAYRYFPTQDHLLFEAVLDSVPVDIDSVLGATDASADPLERVAAVLRVVNRRVRMHEVAFRTVLRLALEKAGDEAIQDPRAVRLLGGRRALWFEQALGPVKDRLGPAAHQRLIAGLSLCVGAEPFVTLRDTCGLRGEEAEATLDWVASTLVRAALHEADDAAIAGDEKA